MTIFLPASALGPEDADLWFLRTFQQTAINFAADGWPMLALSVGALTVVVAIVAFVGSTPWTAASGPRRTKLQDTAWFLMVFATGLAALVSAAFLFPVAPALTMAGSLADFSTDPDAGGIVLKGLGVQSRLVLLGFLGVGVLTCCKHAEGALNAWIFVDRDDAMREKTALDARLGARKSQLAAAEKEKSSDWDSAAKTTGIAILIALVMLAVCANAAALVSWGARIMFGLESDYVAMLSIALVFGTPQIVVVCIAVHEWRKAQWSSLPGGVTGSKWWNRPAARQWVVGVAASILPLLLVTTLISLVEEWRLPQIVLAAALVLSLLAPTAVLIRGQGKFSWKQVGVRSAIEDLGEGIRADERRLAALGSSAAPPQGGAG